MRYRAGFASVEFVQYIIVVVACEGDKMRNDLVVNVTPTGLVLLGRRGRIV